MQNTSQTRLEVNLDALAYNYSFFQKLVPSHTKFIAVVKANAYGSDLVAVAKHFEALGACYLAVVFTREGIALRKSGIKKPILVFEALPSEIENIIEYQLEPALYSPKFFKAFADYAKTKDLKDYPIHLKFNTGLNRLGFSAYQAIEIAKEIKGNSSLKLESVYTHLIESDDVNNRESSLTQIAVYKQICQDIAQELTYMPMRHCANTMGVINFSEAIFDAVRVGIGMYGYTYNLEVNKTLKPVSRLIAPIAQIHELKIGESLGYNRGLVATKPMRTATVPLGHADGISRVYGKAKGSVYIAGKLAPIVGNVCMDMIMIDITQVDCKEGDEVEVFGENQSAIAFADSGNTIVYELLTAISARVPRYVVNKLKIT